MQVTSFPDDNLFPFAWFRTMREAAPVYFTPETNMWQVFRYQDVQRVLTDHSIFSSHIINFDHPLEKSLVNTDPPRHRQLRSLVTQAFTARRVNSLTPRIRACECWQERKVRERREAKRVGEEEAGRSEKAQKKRRDVEGSSP
jgi:cytochrome P450